MVAKERRDRATSCVASPFFEARGHTLMRRRKNELYGSPPALRLVEDDVGVESNRIACNSTAETNQSCACAMTFGG